MHVDRWSRLVIIGNSGSGKSTLALALGCACHLPVHDLDLIHWLDGGIRREPNTAISMVSQCASGESWIIEGVFGWLAAVALTRATALVWTDLAWSECHDGLLRRGLRRGMTVTDQHDMIAWASDYWRRSTSSSFGGHEALFHGFGGAKLRLRTRRAVTDLMSAHAQSQATIDATMSGWRAMTRT